MSSELRESMDNQIRELYKIKCEMLENHARQGCPKCGKKAIEMRQFTQNPNFEYMVFNCGSMVEFKEMRSFTATDYTMTWERRFIKKCKIGGK